jgi:putative component of membrane protein insertase Oxa1/YidC/SpoIIIJ protein YidD
MDKIQSKQKIKSEDSDKRLGIISFSGSKKEYKNIKTFLIKKLFSFYRTCLVPFIKIFGFCGCRFHPSCSHYAETLFLESFNFKNVVRSVARILRCNPWSTPTLTFDPPTPKYILSHYES